MGPGLTGQRNFQNSCEVYIRGAQFRRIVYGLSREELLHLANHAFLARMLGIKTLSDVDMGDVFVSKTKRVAMGVGPAWTRGARRRNAYGDLE